MIQYLEKSRDELQILEDWKPDCWVNISPPFSYEELEELSNKLDIPRDFLFDSLDIDERSRYEIEDETKLIVVNTPILSDNDGEYAALYITVPIGIILTEQNIITITSYENPILQLFFNNKVRGFNPHDKALFVLQIMERNVDRFLSCLKDLNVRRNALEQELYEASRNKELKRLLSLEKSLVYFVTALSSNSLLKAKMQRVDLLSIKDDEEKADLLEDIIIDNSQAQEMANIYSNILGGTMEAFGSIISNNLNIIMQRLTLVTIVLMVPTLVASFYGMNVPEKELPLNDVDGSFWILVAISILTSVVLILFFRRQKLF